jgi:hypothetical protein
MLKAAVAVGATLLLAGAQSSGKWAFIRIPAPQCSASMVALRFDLASSLFVDIKHIPKLRMKRPDIPPHTAVVERQAIATGSEAEIPGSGDGNDPGPGTLMSLFTRNFLARFLNASNADADSAPSPLLNRQSYLGFCNSEERC